MNTPKSKLVTLHLRSQPATEIFLIDGNMTLIARGAEELVHDVAPGLYKVRSRKGSRVRDRLIEVHAGRKDQQEAAPEIATRSAAPLRNTTAAHAPQGTAAERLSREIHLNQGSGSSSLFIYIRDEQIIKKQQAVRWELPPGSVSIHRLTGEFVTDLSCGSTDPAAGYCGMNVRLDPGTWRVRIETEPLGTYEIFITTVEGWQTQVFLTPADFHYAGTTVRRPSLKDALVLMGEQPRGFSQGSEQSDAALTLTALSHNRPLLPQNTLDALSSGNFNDPLLGIYALHVLMIGRQKDHHCNTDTLLQNLTRRLGANHPDLMALRFQIDPDSMPGKQTFDTPPLLYPSWRQMIRASRLNNNRIPQSGILSQFAENILSIKPWLIHRLHPMENQPERKTTSLASAERIVANLIHLPADIKTMIGTQAHPERQNMSDLEVQILQNVLRQSSLNAYDVSGSESVSFPTQARRLVNNLQAPGYSIAHAAGQLAQKFNIAPD